MHCFASLLVHKASCTTKSSLLRMTLPGKQKADSVLLPKNFYSQNLQYRSRHLAKLPHGLSNHISVQFLSCWPGSSLLWVGLLPLIPTSSRSCSWWMELKMLVKMDCGLWNHNHRYEHCCIFNPSVFTFVWESWQIHEYWLWSQNKPMKFSGFKYIKNTSRNPAFFNQIYATHFKLNSYWSLFQFRQSKNRARMWEHH